MNLPFSPNDTCDIYHNGGSPPAPPDVAGVPVFIVPRFQNIHANFAGLFAYTHVIAMPLTADVRDGFGGGGGGDQLYVPNSGSNISFLVQLVVRVRTFGGTDFKQVYVQLASPASWPATEG